MVGALWVRSYWRADRLSRRYGSVVWSLSAARGRLAYTRFDYGQKLVLSPGWELAVYRDPVQEASVGDDNARALRGGWHWLIRTVTAPVGGMDVTLVLVPLW